MEIQPVETSSHGVEAFIECDDFDYPSSGSSFSLPQWRSEHKIFGHRLVAPGQPGGEEHALFIVRTNQILPAFGPSWMQFVFLSI